MNDRHFFINNPIFVKYRKRFDLLKLRSREVLKSAYVNERIVEIPFVLQALAHLPAASSVLDLGCAESALPLHCACLGYRVTGFDFREYPYRHPNLTFVSGDLTKLPFENESFDAVVAVSTIEHVGIGFYSDPKESEAADQKAVAEAFRVLKRGGLFLLTVPFGQPSGRDQQRVYDPKTLPELLKDFLIEEMRYFKSTDLPEGINTWIEISAVDAGQVGNLINTQAVCLAHCRKNRS